MTRAVKLLMLINEARKKKEVVSSGELIRELDFLPQELHEKDPTDLTKLERAKVARHLSDTKGEKQMKSVKRELQKRKAEIELSSLLGLSAEEEKRLDEVKKDIDAMVKIIDDSKELLKWLEAQRPEEVEASKIRKARPIPLKSTYKNIRRRFKIPAALSNKVKEFRKLVKREKKGSIIVYLLDDRDFKLVKSIEVDKKDILSPEKFKTLKDKRKVIIVENLTVADVLLSLSDELEMTFEQAFIQIGVKEKVRNLFR